MLLLRQAFIVLAQKYPSPRPSPTRGEGTFPPLMGGIKGGWRIFILFCEPLAHEGLLCKNFFSPSPLPVPRFHEDKFCEEVFHEDKFLYVFLHIYQIPLHRSTVLTTKSHFPNPNESEE